MDVSFSYVCPVIDHKAIAEWIRRLLSTDSVVTKFIVNKTDALKTDVNLFFTMTNCQIDHSRSLTHRINYKL